jgi:hypothetical protein
MAAAIFSAVRIAMCNPAYTPQRPCHAVSAVALGLLTLLREHLTQPMTGRVIVGFLWLTIVITIFSGWNAGGPRHHEHLFAPPGTRTAPVLDDAGYSDVFSGEAAAEPRVDLYGNEVEDAIGDYRIDRRGDVYERHSPDTEVTQLAAPSL